MVWIFTASPTLRSEKSKSGRFVPASTSVPDGVLGALSACIRPATIWVEPEATPSEVFIVFEVAPRPCTLPGAAIPRMIVRPATALIVPTTVTTFEVPFGM